MDARKTGDPAAISRTTQLVIALGLAQMARFRLDQKAYEDAARLCLYSLQFEDTPETRVEIAIVNLYAKKSSDAVRQATTATEMDPQNALAWTIKGESLLQSEDYSGAAAALNKAIELKPDTESMYALGMAQLGMDEKQEAADTFNEMLARTGDFGWSRVLIGRAYHEQKMTKEATTEFQNALRIDPRTPNGHYFWALTLLQANRWIPTSEVRSHLHEELKLNPRHFLANYWLGYFASNERNYEDSDRYLKLAAEINPSQPEIWMFLGLNAQRRTANWADETYFRKAIALAKNLDPKEHLAIRRAYFALGRMLVSSGRKRDGEEFLQKAQELELQVMAESQSKRGLMKAKDSAGMSGTAAPDIPETGDRNGFPAPSEHGLIGGEEPPLTLRFAATSLQDPVGETEKRLHSILGSALNDLATAEALQEKYDLALKHYREAASWDSRIPGLQRNLGLALFFAGQTGEAIRLLRKVITETPDDGHARAALGLAYYATKDFAKAAQTIAPIADHAVQDPQLGVAWAESLAKTGSKKAAVRALQSLDRPGANLSTENLIQFGKLWQELGESERAAQLFRRALAIDPENSDAKCALHLAQCP